MIISLDVAKEYLRVDGNSEDSTIEILLKSAQNLCMDVARIDNETEFDSAGNIAKTAVLYALGYLYEHREEADHKNLDLTLRALLFGIRKQEF